MKLLLAVCLFAVSQALDCSEGQAVWCRSIEAAKECEAINHCKDTVWKNEKLSEDPSDVCTFCESIMGDVVKFLQDGKEQDEIKKFLEGACQLIPVESVQQECTSVIENDLPILIMLITEEMEPKLICGLMGMCKNSELFKLPAPKKSPVQVTVTGDICADCKAFFGDIKDEITSQTTEQELEQMIDNLFCANLGALADECKQLVAQYVPEILQMIAEEYDPAQDCQVLGFCSMTDAARAILPKLRLKKSQLYNKMKGNDEYCDACKEVINEIKNLDQDPGLQSELENEIDTYLCSQLGSLEDLCKQEVKTYLPEILQLLASELDPEEDCEAIGFCSAEQYPLIDVTQSKITDADIKAMQQSGPKMTKVGASAQCILCEFVMNKLDQMLSENATEQEIIGALDKVCSVLPSAISEECEDFVNTYGPAVLTLLAQELSPDQICTTLGLCSSKVVDEKDEELCLVCETLVQYLDSMLGENATQAEIKQLLDKVCNFLPDTYKAECTDIVNQYEPLLIKYLQQELTPKEVCTELKLCTAFEKIIVPQKQPMLGEKECSWGPAYWCASKENAAKCKAETHCMNHVWN